MKPDTSLTDRPYDWQDKLVMRACWVAGCALILILSYGG